MTKKLWMVVGIGGGASLVLRFLKIPFWWIVALATIAYAAFLYFKKG